MTKTIYDLRDQSIFTGREGNYRIGVTKGRGQFFLQKWEGGWKVLVMLKVGAAQEDLRYLYIGACMHFLLQCPSYCERRVSLFNQNRETL